MYTRLDECMLSFQSVTFFSIFIVQVVTILLIFFRGADNLLRWHKFDDGDVTECKMDDDEVNIQI